MGTSLSHNARGLFTPKPTDTLVAEAEERGQSLKRVVGVLDLSALGLGAIIGTGIFVILGEAIGDAGPAIVVSFILAGLTCAFSALSYAEMASTIPVAGSAYTYSYATMGEIVAWIIGWDLILEYGVSVAAVAVGWGGYLNEALDSIFGITLPDAIAQPPGEGGTDNLPAACLVLAALCIYLMAKQPFDTWMRFFGWMAIGLVIYFLYGRRHSKLRQGLAGREAASPATQRFGRG